MKNRSLLALSLSCLLLSFLSGCAGSIKSTPPLTTPIFELATLEKSVDFKPTYSGDLLVTSAVEVPMVNPSIRPNVESDLVEKAKLDLSQRLGVSTESIEVIRFEEVMWRDGSLGCPKPGMMYTQALVNGSLIVLRVEGLNYEYHSGGLGDPFYCPNPEQPFEGDSGGY